MKRLLKLIGLMLFLMLSNTIFAANELIKINLNETSNIFLLNLSEKGLDNINLSSYEAYINSSSLLNGLTYFYDGGNNLYFWYNGTENISKFYLYRTGQTNIQENKNIGDSYYQITILNPNNYDLVDYQVRIDISNYSFLLNPYIEITDTNKNPIPFCFEQVNGECNSNPSNVIWVKVSIPANSQIPLIINSSNVNNAKNGDQIFDLYSDFQTIDIFTKVYYSNQGYEYKDGYRTLRVYANARKGTTFFKYYPLVVESKIKSAGGQYSDIELVTSKNDYGCYVYNSCDLIGYRYEGYSHRIVIEKGGNTRYYYNYDCVSNWCYITFKISSEGTYYSFCNDYPCSNYYYTSYSFPNIDINFQIGSATRTPNYGGWIDWVRVRKYADQEPTYTIQYIKRTSISQILPYEKDFNHTKYIFDLMSITTNPALPIYLNDNSYFTINLNFNNSNINYYNLTKININGTEYINKTVFYGSEFQEGNYTIQNISAEAIIDGFNLLSYLNVNRWFVVDKTPPIITLNYYFPSKDEIINTLINKINLNISATDNVKLQTCYLNTKSITVPTSVFDNLTIGLNRLYYEVYCTDKAGNSNLASTPIEQYYIHNIIILFSLTNPTFFDKQWQINFVNSEFKKIVLHFLKDGNYLKKYVLKDDNILYEPSRANFYFVGYANFTYELIYDLATGINNYPKLSQPFLIDLDQMKIPIPIYTNDIGNANITVDTFAKVKIKENTQDTKSKVRLAHLFDSNIIYFNHNLFDKTNKEVVIDLPLGFYNLYYKDLNNLVQPYSKTVLVDKDPYTIEVPKELPKQFALDLKTDISNSPLLNTSCNLNNPTKIYDNQSKRYFYKGKITCILKSSPYNMTFINVSVIDNRMNKLVEIMDPVNTSVYSFEINITFGIPFYYWNLKGYVDLDNGERVLINTYNEKFSPDLLPKEFNAYIYLIVVVLLMAVLIYYFGNLGFILANTIGAIFVFTTGISNLILVLHITALLVALIIYLFKPRV